MTKARVSAGVLVTFKRVRSGQEHQAGFDCGEQNGLLILRHSWNTASRIVDWEQLPESLRRRA